MTPTPRRTPFLFPLVALAALLLAPVSRATPFHSVSGHYTIDLPDGWVAERPAYPTPANDVPVTRDGMPMIDVILRPAHSTDHFPPTAFIAIERAGGQTYIENDTIPGAWHTTIDQQEQTFSATRRVPLVLLFEKRSDARGWITPTSIVTLSMATTGKQFDAYEPAFRHIADGFRIDNPGVILPSIALAAIAAAVVWVARRAKRQGA